MPAEVQCGTDAELLDNFRRLANTLVGFYRVESTERDVGVRLHDLLKGDRLFAHTRCCRGGRKQMPVSSAFSIK